MEKPSGISPNVAVGGLQAWVSQAVVASFMAGGVAGAVSRTVVSPLERLKILLQVQSNGRTEYKMSIPKALGKIWREEGFKGMMAGNGVNCIRIVPYSAVQFGSYNLYKPVSDGIITWARTEVLTLFLLVLRIESRRTSYTTPQTMLWRRSRHHFGDCYVPTRYRTDTPFDSISLIRRPHTGTSGEEIAGYVGHARHHVQD
jgi:hypothetical protein